MKKSAHEKGKALEKAVRAIEAIVFKNQPELVGKKVIVEANRHLNDKGVPHEVDLIVYVDKDSPQQITHAYECKNRATPADKNDIILFAHKLKLLGAASGTVVARQFTRGAYAQAAQEPRIKLFTFTQDFWTCADQLKWIATSYEAQNARTTLHYRNPWPTERVPNLGSLCSFQSKPVSLRAFVGGIVDEHLSSIGQQTELAQLEGLHCRQTATVREFATNELIVDGHDVQVMSLEIPYLISVRHARLVAKFNIRGRGGHYEFVCEQDPFEGKVFSVEITTISV